MTEPITRATHPTPCSRCPARAELEAEVERVRAWRDEHEAAREDFRQKWRLAEAEVERLREAIKTLRAYIAAPEGTGPIRYIEALALCDDALNEG